MKTNKQPQNYFLQVWDVLEAIILFIFLPHSTKRHGSTIILMPFANLNLLDPCSQLNKFYSFSNTDFQYWRKTTELRIFFFLNAKTNVFNSSYTLKVQCPVINSWLWKALRCMEWLIQRIASPFYSSKCYK